ncbi:lactonase family protein [Streptomyces alkaliterrae]|uniref:Lactonase family protein n=1 Tax=Streptomyces alkaliterrae TaxID=2213162 RepID=A0A5P0YL56_9ACTN|nr:lactonase family protein [Streptomyces alkaliterrae]MBB1253654.1 lactonase family protein [Streptomyces alkaliterrae]MBB1258850.1 lactonase family protein [Streptomyces alkaliterrae]MQS01083.1 beta-propeller fold lactonase family protein [Streptomyces alkaliterrae]
MAETAGGQRAYIGSFTEAGGRGVTVALVDPDTGALTVTGHHHTVANPSYLALAPGSGTLYAVSETERGAVAAHSLARPDSPELIGAAVPVDASAPTHLTVAAGQLFTANYGSGSVSALTVRQDGSLGGRPPSTVTHTGDGPDRDRQAGPHAHCVVADPRWRWLLSADLGTDSVWVYRLEHTEPGLSLHAEVSLAPGSGPRHLGFHPAGDRVYTVNELDSTLTVCRWDGQAGKLEPAASVSTRPPRARGVNHPSALVISPDGLRAWVANRGDDTIAVFSLDAARQSVELVDTVSCGGHWPRDLVLDPTGRRLYAANERSGEVVWFDLDARTGTPYRIGEVRVPAVSCLVFA